MKILKNPIEEKLKKKKIIIIIIIIHLNNQVNLAMILKNEYLIKLIQINLYPMEI